MSVRMAVLTIALVGACAEKAPTVEVIAESPSGSTRSLVRPKDISCAREGSTGVLELRLTSDAAQQVQAYIAANPSITLKVMVEGRLINEIRPRAPAIVAFEIGGASKDEIGRLAPNFEPCEAVAT